MNTAVQTWTMIAAAKVL